MASTVAVIELVFNLSVKAQNINGLKPHKLGCRVFNKACILVVVICLWLKALTLYRNRYLVTNCVDSCLYRYRFIGTLWYDSRHYKSVVMARYLVIT